jgi:hypothetical protein
LKNIKNIFKVGMTALEVVFRILELNKEIQSLIFKLYSPVTNFDKRPRKKSLENMLFHNPSEKEYTLIIPKDNSFLKMVNGISSKLPPKYDLGVASLVYIGDEKFHIPMMDFKCDYSAKNLKKIKEFLKNIGQVGVILFSGMSYHFYGINLIPDSDWHEFMGKCLLFNDYVDTRYIAHRLIDGYSCLRISRGTKNRPTPRVVSVIKGGTSSNYNQKAKK